MKTEDREQKTEVRIYEFIRINYSCRLCLRIHSSVLRTLKGISESLNTLHSAFII